MEALLVPGTTPEDQLVAVNQLPALRVVFWANAGDKDRIVKIKKTLILIFKDFFIVINKAKNIFAVIRL